MKATKERIPFAIHVTPICEQTTMSIKIFEAEQKISR